MPEVLAVEADVERRKEEQRRDDGEFLRHLVLVVRDLRLEVVAAACEQVARQVEPVDCAEQLVVGVAERNLDLVWQELAAFDVDASVDHTMERLARRADGATHTQQL